MTAVRVADTSFLYALFSRSDDFHGKAVRAAEARDAITIPAEIFAETMALIHHRQGFDAARGAGEWIRRQPYLEIGAPNTVALEASWRIFLGARGRLSYPDAVVVAWCRRRGSVALSYDARILAFARK